ncbi:MAG: PLP-dependent transferase, partial [Elusimicrobiota bacterium]|nr:PLP-dependent transferase [Elusimicrobiota bacterium]
KIPAIEKIFYPGFKDFKGYNIHKKQAKGAGGMISFTLKKDYSVNEFFKNLKIIILAESLGGAESLICHPASMTHASVPEKMRKEIGIADNLIRFSVGIEDKKDLAEDLEQAFKKSKKS